MTMDGVTGGNALAEVTIYNCALPVSIEIWMIRGVLDQEAPASDDDLGVLNGSRINSKHLMSFTHMVRVLTP